MNLLIEHGQLLKPYALPWSPDGWVIPKDWTPERTPEMTARFDALQAARPEAAPFALWEQVEHDEGERLQSRRKPWPGWVMLPAPSFPNATKKDKRISKAYRRLYVEMDERPPDGRYSFRGGKMERVK